MTDDPEGPSILPMLSRSGLVGLLTLALLQVSSGAAGAGETEPGRGEILSAARSVMSAAGLTTFISLDQQGHPQARTMDPFPPEEDFTVWMGTKRSTRKVLQIQKDSRTTLHYFDPAGPSYVTLIGHAEIVDDRAENLRHFKPAWESFYQDGPRGPDYLLIRFRPFRLEMVSIEHGIAADPLSKRPAILELENEAPHR